MGVLKYPVVPFRPEGWSLFFTVEMEHPYRRNRNPASIRQKFAGICHFRLVIIVPLKYEQCRAFKANLMVQFPLCTKTEINLDRKSTRLNSSHVAISYAVFCF